MNRFLFAAVALPLAALAAPAMAFSTITQSVDIPAANAPLTSVLGFAQFDGSLGTLTSIDLSFTASSLTRIDFRNNTPRAREWTISPSGTATLSGHGFNLSDSDSSGPFTVLLEPRFGPSNPRTGSASYALGYGASGSLVSGFEPSNPRTGSASYALGYGASGSLVSGFEPFVGNGTVNLAFSRLANFAVGGSGGGHTLGDSPFAGRATLSYNFAVPSAVVPEPATWAMLIAGFGLVGAAARQRRRTVVAA